MTPFSRIPALTRIQFRDTMLVLIAAGLADALCGVVDGIFVGRFLGEDALAAHGIVSPVFIFLCIFSYMISDGFQQTCTVAVGRGEMTKANGMFSLILLLTLGFSLAMGLIGVLFPHTLVRMTGAPFSGEIADLSADYLRAVSFGTPSLVLFLVLIPVLQIDGQRKLVHVGSLVMGVSDVVIDVLNVEVLHWGMTGIGLATSLSYTLGLLVLLTYFFRKNRFFHFRKEDIAHASLGRVFSAGGPSAIRVGGHTVSMIMLNFLIMSLFGATAMAAFSVQRNLSSLLISFGIGISGSTLLLSGISYGEQDRRGLMDVVRMSAYASIVLMGLLGLLVFVLARPLVSLYLGPQDHSFSMSVAAVRWFAVSIPLTSWVRCMGCYLQGIEKNRLSAWVFIFEELACLVLCAIVMGLVWGAEGVFAAFAASPFILILALNLLSYLRRDRRYKGMEAFLGVKENFGVPPQDRLEHTMTSMDQVCEVSRQVHSFCLDHGVPKDQSYLASLYVEEMGNIIMIYGFSDGKKHYMEVRLSLYMDLVILRFKDNCRRFDIVEKAGHWKEDSLHPETSIGVRMMMRACEVIRYNNTLNTNNLMVVL